MLKLIFPVLLFLGVTQGLTVQAQEQAPIDCGSLPKTNRQERLTAMQCDLNQTKAEIKLTNDYIEHIDFLEKRNGVTAVVIGVGAFLFSVRPLWRATEITGGAFAAKKAEGLFASEMSKLAGQGHDVSTLESKAEGAAAAVHQGVKNGITIVQNQGKYFLWKGIEAQGAFQLLNLGWYVFRADELHDLNKGLHSHLSHLQGHQDLLESLIQYN